MSGAREPRSTGLPQQAKDLSGTERETAAPRREVPRLPSADPWRRLMGIAYESIILFGVLWFADYAFSALTQFKGHPGPLRTAFQVFTVLVLAAYFVGFWALGRRSLPMKTLSLLVLDERDRPLSHARAAGRFAAALGLWLLALAAGYYLSGWLYLLVLLPFSWTLVDPDRRALYDLIAGTRLVNKAPDPGAKSVDV